MLGVIPENEPTVAKSVPTEEKDLSELRRWFREAVDKNKTWRDAADEDYKYYCGDQWNDADRLALAEQGRPSITVNQIKPLINILSGYQRLNRYEPQFLPRTANDLELCKVRQAMTKFIFDLSDYDTVESMVFFDAIVSGRGWFEVSYDWDPENLDGDAKIKRESPFNIYVDPESRQADLSDAEYVIRARWLSKELLKQIYPDKSDVIDATVRQYAEEEDAEFVAMEPLWFQRETKKVRLVECYYREYVSKNRCLLQNGDIVDEEKVTPEMGPVVRTWQQQVQQVKVVVFCDGVVFERLASPYEHGEFPFVQLVCYYTGERDIPAGVVRDLKDMQREINKRRSQKMHILNTQANSGWLFEEETLSAVQKDRFKKFGATPGAMLEFRAGRTPPQRIEPPNMPAGIIQDEAANVEDIKRISGVNEAMLGSDTPSGTSGRAIELKQKQAVTHVASLFDNLRAAKKQMLYLLWGKKKKKGIIQQFYTDEKTFRVVGDDGNMSFVTVNQEQMAVDPLRGAITQTLNDLTVGEFDIVVADTPAASTQRVAQFYAMLEAVKLGIPIPPDMIVEASDWPQKAEIKKRLLEEKAKQEQAMQMQAQAAQQPPKGPNESINFKDLPPDGKMQMAQKAGIQLDPRGVVLQDAINSGVPLPEGGKGLPTPNVERPYQPQGGTNEAPLQQLYQAAQSGQLNPQQIQQAMQAGVIPPEIAQNLLTQMRRPQGSAERSHYVMTPQQQQEAMRVAL